MRFTKKPVEIEAWQLQRDIGGMPKWLTDELGKRAMLWSADCSMSIKTLEGMMLAKLGDFIIKGVQGELYPCKYEIFLETYEPADDEARRFMS